MPVQVSIPLAALNAGAHDFGPAQVAGTDTMAVLSVDRTVSKGNVKGFNGTTADNTGQVTVFQSNNGGQTWEAVAWCGFSGGSVIDKRTGQPMASNNVTVPLWPGVNRQAKAEIVIAGPSSVAVQGTLTVS